MKQAVMLRPGEIEFRHVPDPAPGPGEVRLRIRSIGICGSDVHVWHGRHPFTRYPVVQGHEFSACIDAVGPGVEGLEPGTPATATPQETCGQCGPCRRGDHHICERLKVWGFQTHGVAQDYFVTRADQVVVVPAGFTPLQGALVEPCAVAVHATGRLGDLAGRRVVVSGGGPIGNLTAQAVRARGGEVLLCDLSDARLDIARQCGIAHVSNPRTEPLADAARRAFGGHPFDRAFECAGAEASINALIDGIEKGGAIVAVGVYSERPRIDMAAVGEHELRLVGTLMYRKPDYRQAIEWIQDGRFQTDPLISRQLPFDQFADAYRLIDVQGDRMMKVFITVNP